MPFDVAISETGKWTLRLLLLSLLVTPLQRIGNWPRLIIVRRMIGLAALAYGLLHFCLYIADQGFHLAHVFSEVARRIHLTIGFVALAGLAVLGVPGQHKACAYRFRCRPHHHGDWRSSNADPPGSETHAGPRFPTPERITVCRRSVVIGEQSNRLPNCYGNREGGAGFSGKRRQRGSMVNANSRAAGEPNDPESLIGYVIHQYGLTRDQAREIVREYGNDREMVDAMAGKARATRKP